MQELGGGGGGRGRGSGERGVLGDAALREWGRATPCHPVPSRVDGMRRGDGERRIGSLGDEGTQGRGARREVERGEACLRDAIARAHATGSKGEGALGRESTPGDERAQRRRGGRGRNAEIDTMTRRTYAPSLSVLSRLYWKGQFVRWPPPEGNIAISPFRGLFRSYAPSSRAYFK